MESNEDVWGILREEDFYKVKDTVRTMEKLPNAEIYATADGKYQSAGLIVSA